MASLAMAACLFRHPSAADFKFEISDLADRTGESFGPPGGIGRVHLPLIFRIINQIRNFILR